MTTIKIDNLIDIRKLIFWHHSLGVVKTIYFQTRPNDYYANYIVLVKGIAAIKTNGIKLPLNAIV